MEPRGLDDGSSRPVHLCAQHELTSAGGLPGVVDLVSSPPVFDSGTRFLISVPQLSHIAVSAVHLPSDLHSYSLVL